MEPTPLPMTVALRSEAEIALRSWEGLSDWFDPLLPHFAREALRCGGDVLCMEGEGRVHALYLESPAERVASVFTRDPSLAQALLNRPGPWGIFSDLRLPGERETYRIYRGALPGISAGHRFRHSVRLLRPPDLPAIEGLLREVLGVADPAWFRTLPAQVEQGFLVEVDGRIAGAAWATCLGNVGRLHSLAVRSPYRGLGVGADLLAARLLWLRERGTTEVLSEIAETIVASCALAERQGLVVAGEMYLYPTEGRVPGREPPTFGAPRTSDRPSPSSR
jgi:GNAT superfamily N-acetyltransferase